MQRNNGKPACASCKHQRKKCTEKCILSTLFPASKTREFLAVHKVFGVSNVTKLVKNIIKEEDRKRAIDSLIWEAFCRQRDPILGPYGEYVKVSEELKMYKNLQLSTQGGMVYRPTPNLNGWINNNNNKNMGVFNSNNIGAFKYVNNSGNCNVADLSPCSFSSDHESRQEKDAASVILLPPENNYNYQYYFPGQFGSIDTKQLETTLWEGSS